MCCEHEKLLEKSHVKAFFPESILNGCRSIIVDAIKKACRSGGWLSQLTLRVLVAPTEGRSRTRAALVPGCGRPLFWCRRARLERWRLLLLRSVCVFSLFGREELGEESALLHELSHGRRVDSVLTRGRANARLLLLLPLSTRCSGPLPERLAKGVRRRKGQRSEWPLWRR